MRYTQLRIVESSGQMIAGGRILPRQYDVSRAQRIGHYRSGALILPCERAAKHRRLCHVNAPAVRLPSQAHAALCAIHFAAGAARKSVVEGTSGAVREDTVVRSSIKKKNNENDETVKL